MLFAGPGQPPPLCHRSVAALLCALAAAPLAAQEALIECPVAVLETRASTELPAPWRDAPRRGSLRSLEVRAQGENGILTCVYSDGAARTTVSRSLPAGIAACRADQQARVFRCTPQPVGAGVAGRCASEVQNRIPWDYTGNASWQPANLRRLCGSAGDSAEPARCFEKVMHGGVDHGGGTRWDWRNAVTLCASTRNARLTVGCFSTAIRVGGDWRKAIRDCTGG